MLRTVLSFFFNEPCLCVGEKEREDGGGGGEVEGVVGDACCECSVGCRGPRQAKLH